MENETERRLLESEAEKDDPSLLSRIWAENKLVYRTAFPAILFRLSIFAVYPVTQAFIGHISQVELAAYALVQTIVIRFASGVAVGTGLQAKAAVVNEFRSDAFSHL
ncbi:hypothetical protein V2J09_003255 [Rumex salicifolius]